MSQILISHRGNISGINSKKENRMDYIFESLNLGYDTEIDCWFENNQWYLGHDEPKYKTGITIFKNPKVWCHIKNTQGLEEIKKITGVNYFWHDKDDYTLTSTGTVWCKVGSIVIKNSICVLPEQGYNGNIKNCKGICSDCIADWKNKL